LTVSTFYPDANPETTSVDGYTSRGTNETWANKRAGATGGANDTAAANYLELVAHNVADLWSTLTRVFSLFDTSSLGDLDTIDSATYEFVSIDRTNTLSDSLSLITTTPASNTGLVDADYAQVAAVKQATDITFASLTVDSATYNVMTLNATGRGNISKTGVSKFGLRTTNDADNTTPTWSSGVASSTGMASAEETLTGDKRPKLVVTHTAPPSTFVPKMLAF
jgi:hypothetical protein